MWRTQTSSFQKNKKAPVHTLGRKPCFRGTTRIPDNDRALLTNNEAKPPQPTRKPSALVLKRELQMNASQAACSRWPPFSDRTRTFYFLCHRISIFRTYIKYHFYRQKASDFCRISLYHKNFFVSKKALANCLLSRYDNKKGGVKSMLRRRACLTPVAFPTKGGSAFFF